MPTLAPTVTENGRFPVLRLSSSDADLIEFLAPGRAIHHGNCDLFKGHYLGGRVKIVLAMKLPRIVGDADSGAETARRRFEREAKIWSELNHHNILPFYGFVVLQSGAYLISPWVERGDLAKFLMTRQEYFALTLDQQNSKPQDIRDTFLAFDEVSIILGIASGLACLHAKGVIHGDLKGSNILLDYDLNPLICDFGLTKNDEFNNTSDTLKGVATPRWQCPTLLVAGAKRTEKTDIFSFAMTICEVLTGCPPFPRLSKFDIQVNYSLGKRPPCEPQSYNGKDFTRLWGLAASCWAQIPEDRPDAEQVVRTMESL